MAFRIGPVIFGGRQGHAQGKNGYTFQMQGTPGGYTINVNPDAFGGTGRRSFYSDQSLVIRNNWGPEPATASSPEIK